MVKGVKFLSRLLNASCSDVITVPLFFSLPPIRPRPLSSFKALDLDDLTEKLRTVNSLLSSFSDRFIVLSNDIFGFRYKSIFDFVRDDLTRP